MLRLSHKDCKSTWQAGGIKKADAPRAALELILSWRFSAGPAQPNSPEPGERRELDPTGWKAVWVDGDNESQVDIPTIPPAPAPPN